MFTSCRMPNTIGWLTILMAASARSVLCCGFPGSPPHAKVVTTDEHFMEGSVVTFECDPGYQLLGRSMMRCVNSEWDSEGKPYCVRELAFLKPTTMSSRNQTSTLAVDDQPLTCAETDSRMKHEWWVDLIEPSSIQVVEVRFGVDMSNVAINVVVDNPDSNTTSNCIETTNITVHVGASQYFTCNRSTFGRGLTIMASANQDFTLKLCEVKVYSQSLLSPQDACGRRSKGKVETLKGQCYEVTPTETSFHGAVAFCTSQGSSLWTGEQSEFVSWMMNVHKLDSVWYQSNSSSNNCSVFTLDDQFDSNQQQDIECEDTFGICVRPPQSCGKPRLPKHLASWNRVEKVFTGARLDDFWCENGYHLSGPSTYRCLANGRFQEQIPTTCGLSMCGRPPSVPNAFPVLGADPRYHCVNDSFVLYGDPVLKCDPIKSQWSMPHVVCVRLPTSTTHTAKSLQERLLQGINLFPKTSKFGLAVFVIAMITIKILITVAIFNLVRFYRVVKPELIRKHNSTVMLFSIVDELSKDLDSAPTNSDDNNNKLEVNAGLDFELSSGDAHVVTRTTNSSTPKAPERPKMRLNESSIREFKTD